MKMIQFSPPDIREEDIKAVTRVLQSGWITTGSETAAFEERLAAYTGTNKVICCSSCTFGMELVLRFLGIGEGDEVIVPAYTYTASAAVIYHTGAKIVFCDTGKNSFWIDYDQLSKLITKKTKAIIVVDIAGGVCNYDRIYSIVEEKKNLFCANNAIQSSFGRIIVLGDCAHSLGARRIYNGNWCKTGMIADFSVFSFHAVKNITTAEGGAITWKPSTKFDSDELYKKMRYYILHGQTKDALSKNQSNNWEYDIIYPAYKGNMTDIMAALGLSQMNRIDEILNRRREIIESYQKGLKSSGISYFEAYTENMTSSGHLFLMRIGGYSEEERNQLIVRLANLGISTNVHYKPLPMMTAYKNLKYDISDYPNAYHQYRNEISLPVHMLLSADDIEYIIRSLKSLLK